MNCISFLTVHLMNTLGQTFLKNMIFSLQNIANSSEDEKIRILKDILNNPERVNELSSFAEFVYKSEYMRNNKM